MGRRSPKEYRCSIASWINYEKYSLPTVDRVDLTGVVDFPLPGMG